MLLLDKFHAKPDDRERVMKRLVKFIEGLNQIEPVDCGHLILGIFRVDEDGDFLDPCLYCKEELEAGCRADSELAGLEDIEELAEEEIERLAHVRDFPESYAFEFSPWNEILGYEIDVRNTYDVGATELCAAVIWEMTFFGFLTKNVWRLSGKNSMRPLARRKRSENSRKKSRGNIMSL